MPQSHKRYLSTTDANGVVSGQTPNKRQRNAPPPQLFGDRMNNQGLGQTQTQTQTPTQTHDHSLNVNHGHMQSNPTNAVAVPVTASAPTPAIPSTTTTPSSTSTFAPPPSASILPSSSTTAAATLSSSHAPPPATMAPTAAAPTAASAHHHHHHHPPLPPAGGPDAPPAIHPWAAVTVRWQEQAMDLFFRDFADEDSDLQIKIGEKVLTDENKAMLFCKMPPQLRRHYVKRLREAHNRIA